MLLSMHYNSSVTIRTKESTQFHYSLNITTAQLTHHQAALSCTEQLHDGSAGLL